MAGKEGLSNRPPFARGQLEFNHVHKNFHSSGAEGVSAVFDVSLNVRAGEFIVVLGPSGCGKTTLMNLAAGMLTPDAGEVRLDGVRVDGPGPERAMVFQDHALMPWLNAKENVELGLKLAGVPKREREDRCAEALDAVRLPNAGKRLVHELSGGMRQRVSIARALVLNPAVLLMDEPFAALDAQTRTLLHEHLQDLWCSHHKTILFVTHSVVEAVRLADRVIVLRANPGAIRREVTIDLPHPRSFDSPELTELNHLIRGEIQTEVMRVHAKEVTVGAAPHSVDDLRSVVGDEL